MCCQPSCGLWFHRPVVDPHVVDQAGPEATGLQVLAGADVQTIVRAREAGLGVSGDFDIINIENPV